MWSGKILLFCHQQILLEKFLANKSQFTLTTAYIHLSIPLAVCSMNIWKEDEGECREESFQKKQSSLEEKSELLHLKQLFSETRG